MIFFTGDLHLNHSNIITYANRPFEDVWDMNDTIIKQWNERVKENDTIFIVGDFGFRMKIGDQTIKPIAFLDYSLNGNKILISGNHDNRNNVSTIIESMVIKYGGEQIKLVHDPKYADKKYKFNFCCHTHKSPIFQKINMENEPESYIINVGMDLWNFYPITFNEIMHKFSQWRKQHENKKT
ncbi:MAG: metallophosphoesterase [Candidatus Nanoarchaeia archaeon]|nr:metallophosphoesterase [Candidatus Nanoarchaeia archaeon]